MESSILDTVIIVFIMQLFDFDVYTPHQKKNKISVVVPVIEIDDATGPAPRIRYNLQLVMSVVFSPYFPFRQPAANSAGVW